ncbi:hypothetical protein, partial [Nodularia sphaerocarpa]|uniref:hypothetical protein n=1 Tax=Nodularia sphaerocarpa TaxID=137816 RepID=UPI0023309150
SLVICHWSLVRVSVLFRSRNIVWFIHAYLLNWLSQSDFEIFLTSTVNMFHGEQVKILCL